MKLYRLYTEDKNREEIEQAANVLFHAYTLSTAIGVWRGTKENSLCLEVFAQANELQTAWYKMKVLAAQIKTLNEQECVLLVELDARGEFV